MTSTLKDFGTGMMATKLSDGYQNWASGEPNDHRGEDCGDFLSPTNRWNDEHCDQNYGYICQKDLIKSSASDYTEVVYTKPSTDRSFAQQRCSLHGFQLSEERKYEIVPETLQQKHGNLRAKYQRECLVMEGNKFEKQICDETLTSACKAIHTYDLKISTEQEDYMESDRIEIDCTASGIPLPNVTWHQGYAPVSESTDQEIFQISKKGRSTLIIKNAQVTDTSRYRCFAQNQIGNDVRKTKGYLDVRVHPKTLAIPVNKGRSAGIQEQSALSDDIEYKEPSSCQAGKTSQFL
uniref:uncharacterized protein LOC120326458 n=1 Tax=Styela clava TaxID=7725 RepID=UPI0019397AC7|nr:uncharacterized protein LOC120326458 [Styela clava]